MQFHFRIFQEARKPKRTMRFIREFDTKILKNRVNIEIKLTGPNIVVLLLCCE